MLVLDTLLNCHLRNAGVALSISCRTISTFSTQRPSITNTSLSNWYPLISHCERCGQVGTWATHRCEVPLRDSRCALLPLDMSIAQRSSLHDPCANHIPPVH